MSAAYASGPTGPETGRQRHAPLYGRIVVEEELPATHRDVMLVRFIFNNFNSEFMNNFECLLKFIAIKSDIIVGSSSDAITNTHTFSRSSVSAVAEIKCGFNKNL